MFRTLAFILLATSATAQSIDTLQQIDRLFSQWNNATPGGSVLVARGNTIVYHKAFGLADLEHRVPNTTETIFESGSVAKQFTAAAVVLLAEEGKLTLTDDVRKYIPELPVYQKPITILHLFNHTSGLKDWGSVGSLNGWPRTTRVYTNDLALQIVCRQKTTNFVPGAEYSYSNANYTLLVAIVERVSKQSLADFTHERFFKPLGMTNTQWRDNFREVVLNRSIAYAKENGIYQQLMPFENVHGHGGLLTTTGDLLKWNQLLETKAIFGAEAAGWRIQNGKLNNGQSIRYAAGLNAGETNGFKEISHSGSTAGYRAWLAYYPQKKLTVVLLSNDGGFSPAGKGNEVAQLYIGAPPKNETVKKATAATGLQSGDVGKWAGTYRSIRGFDFFSIASENNELRSNNTTLTQTHKDTLTDGRLKWCWSAKKILLSNPWDTTSYIKVLPPDLSPKSIASFAGTYESAEADATFKVEVRDQKVIITLESLQSLALTPVFKDGFRDDDFSLYEFRRDKNGKITSLNVSLSRALNIPFTREK